MSSPSRSLTLEEVLKSEEGIEYKVVTDNDLYGTTVINRYGVLQNVRTHQHIPVTAELLKSKFRKATKEVEVSVNAFVEAYRLGRKIKIELDGMSRFIQRNEDESMPEDIKDFIESIPFPVQAATSDEIVTMKELMDATFYVVD